MHVAAPRGFLHRAWRKMGGKRRDWPTPICKPGILLMALVPCVASMTSRNCAAGARAVVPAHQVVGLTDRKVHPKDWCQQFVINNAELLERTCRVGNRGPGNSDPLAGSPSECFSTTPQGVCAGDVHPGLISRPFCPTRARKLMVILTCCTMTLGLSHGGLRVVNRPARIVENGRGG